MKQGTLAEKRRLKMATDPVCGMDVDEKRAVATSVYKKKTYYFCAQACKRAFEKDPGKYIET